MCLVFLLIFSAAPIWAFRESFRFLALGFSKSFKAVLLILILGYIVPINCMAHDLAADSCALNINKEVINIYIRERMDSTGNYCEYYVTDHIICNNRQNRSISNRIEYAVKSKYKHYHIKKTQNENIDLKVRVNGREITDIDKITISRRFVRQVHLDWIWHEWHSQFKPGDNSIHIEYSQRTSKSDDLHYQNIYLSFYHGERFNCNVDTVVVCIHFPIKIDEEIIMPYTIPDAYDIADSTISWIITDYKISRDDEFRFEFMTPSTFQDISQLRREIEKDNHNADSKIALAELYLSTAGPGGLGSRFIPHGFSEKRFQERLEKLSKEDGAYLSACYLKGIGKYEYSLREELIRDPEERLQDIIIFTNNRNWMFAGYSRNPIKWYPDYYHEAEILLKDALNLQPLNAYAWNLYISNIYKMYNGAFAPVRWDYGFGVIDIQESIINDAYANCPEDQGIRLWYELVTDEEKQLPEHLGILMLCENEDENELLIPIYQQNGYDVHGNIKTNEIETIRRCYEEAFRDNFTKTLVPFLGRGEKEVIRCKTYELNLKSSGFSDKDVLEVITLLSTLHYYTEYYYREISEYNDSIGIIQ